LLDSVYILHRRGLHGKASAYHLVEQACGKIGQIVARYRKEYLNAFDLRAKGNTACSAKKQHV